jgi:hypothetical protein
MNDLLLDPNDTGEIPTAAPGETLTRIYVGEATENLMPYADGLGPALRRSAADITGELVLIDVPLGFGFDGPQAPPPPLPPIPDETARMSLLDSLGAGPGDEQPDGYEGRHRDPYDRTAVEGEGRWGRLVEARRPLGRRIAVAAVVAAVVGASVCVGLVVAAAAVIW